MPLLRFAKLALGTLCAGFPLAAAAAQGATRETIVFIRHAEKAPGGLGQLSCKGLNRALALPAVIKARYGTPDAVFAPDPAQKKQDGTGSYDYVRPLATVEPAAIRFGLPIHADFGYGETDRLREALLDPALANAVVLVAWEHHALNAMVPAMVAALGGDPTPPIAAWESDDFDSVWKVTIARDAGRTRVDFARESQGLQGRLADCPAP